MYKVLFARRCVDFLHPMILTLVLFSTVVLNNSYLMSQQAARSRLTSYDRIVCFTKYTVRPLELYLWRKACHKYTKARNFAESRGDGAAEA